MSDNDNNQWYTNKELFERLGDLKDDVANLRVEMRETRTLIKSYNGLREKIEKIQEENDILKSQVQTIMDKDTAKNSTVDSLRNWGGWLFGFVSLLVLLYNQIN